MREAHELDVSLSGKNSHIFYTTCFNGSLGGDMATTATCFFSFEVGHEIGINPLYSHGKVLDHVLLLHSSIYYPLVDVMDLAHCLPCNFLRLYWIRLRCVPLRCSSKFVASCKLAQ